MGPSNEDVPYRSPVTPKLPTSQPSSTDQADYSTLREVRQILADAIGDLDKWHAFDLQKTDGLSLKQQIVAHRLAFDILTPLLESINSTMVAIDNRYKGKQ